MNIYIHMFISIYILYPLKAVLYSVSPASRRTVRPRRRFHTHGAPIAPVAYLRAVRQRHHRQHHRGQRREPWEVHVHFVYVQNHLPPLRVSFSTPPNTPAKLVLGECFHGFLNRFLTVFYYRHFFV
jgi:hypothetical protein